MGGLRDMEGGWDELFDESYQLLYPRFSEEDIRTEAGRALRPRSRRVSSFARAERGGSAPGNRHLLFRAFFDLATVTRWRPDWAPPHVLVCNKRARYSAVRRTLNDLVLKLPLLSVLTVWKVLKRPLPSARWMATDCPGSHVVGLAKALTTPRSDTLPPRFTLLREARRATLRPARATTVVVPPAPAGAAGVPAPGGTAFRSLRKT